MFVNVVKHSRCLLIAAGLVGSIASAMPSYTLLGATHRHLQAGSGGLGSPGNLQAFVENVGQYDPQVKFMGTSPNTVAWVTNTGVTFDFYKLRTQVTKTRGKFPRTTYYKTSHVVEMTFAGGNKGSVAGGALQVPTTSHVLSHSGHYTSKVFQQTTITGIYNDINFSFYYDGANPRYDLIVNPGGDPTKIGLSFPGAESVQLASGSNVTIGTRWGPIQMGALHAYQAAGIQQLAIPATFRVVNGVVKFSIGKYDHTKPLIIDPIVFGTLLGGDGAGTNGSDVNVGTAVAVDTQGFSYVTGTTLSQTFPTTLGALKETPDSPDAFVTKFLKDGSNVVYSTRLGGSGEETGMGIQVDALGYAYLCGLTTSTDFPTGATAGVQTTNNASPGSAEQGYICKLSPDGSSLAWSTYMGGSTGDEVIALQLDQNGNIYFAGSTLSADLLSGKTIPTPFQSTFGGVEDAFVGALAPSGATLNYLTFVGGFNTTDNTDDPAVTTLYFNGDGGTDFVPTGGLAVTANGQAYIATTTDALDYPYTAGAYNNAHQTPATVNDVGVTGFNPDGSVIYSLTIGGNEDEESQGIAVDSFGYVYILGQTSSFNYPTTPNTLDTSFGGGTQPFVTKISPDGTTLVWSTFIPCDANIHPRAIALDSLNEAYIVGWGTDDSLPLVNSDGNFVPGPPSNNSPYDINDGFVTVLDPLAETLYYSSYLGHNPYKGLTTIGAGAGATSLSNIAIDPSFSVFVVGSTWSGGFPLTAGAFETVYNAAPDALLCRLTIRPPVDVASVTVTPNFTIGGVQPFPQGTVTLTSAAPAGGIVVLLSSNSPDAVVQPSITVPEGSTTSAPFDIQTKANIPNQVVATITAAFETSSASQLLTVSPWLEALAISRSSIVGGNNMTGTVTLAAAAPTGGLTVNLSSSNTAAASVDQGNGNGTQITVPAGATTATFNITTFGVATDSSVVITASYDAASYTQNLTVQQAHIQTFTIAPPVVAGGTQAVGTVTLDGLLPASGTAPMVTFTSDTPLVVPAPASQPFPSTQTSISFPVTTNQVTQTTTATLTATLGTQTVTTLLTVEEFTVTSLTFSPTSASAGSSVTGTVTISQAAPVGGLTLNLSQLPASDGSVTFPATVTIPQGSVTATFPVTVNSVLNPETVTIQAAFGASTVTGSFNVTGLTVSLSISPDSIIGGDQTAVGTLTISSPAPAGGAPVSISYSSAPDSGIVTNPVTNVTIPAGQTTLPFDITTIAVSQAETVTITATLGASSSGPQTLSVSPIGLDSITFSPDPVRGGVQNTTCTVTIQAPAPAGGAVIGLSQSYVDPNGYEILLLPASVTIAPNQTSYSFSCDTFYVSRDVSTTVSASLNGSIVQAVVVVTR